MIMSCCGGSGAMMGQQNYGRGQGQSNLSTGCGPLKIPAPKCCENPCYGGDCCPSRWFQPEEPCRQGMKPCPPRCPTMPCFPKVCCPPPCCPDPCIKLGPCPPPPCCPPPVIKKALVLSPPLCPPKCCPPLPCCPEDECGCPCPSSSICPVTCPSPPMIIRPIRNNCCPPPPKLPGLPTPLPVCNPNIPCCVVMRPCKPRIIPDPCLRPEQICGIACPGKKATCVKPMIVNLKVPTSQTPMTRRSAC